MIPENCAQCPFIPTHSLDILSDGMDCPKARYDDVIRKAVPGTECPIVLLDAANKEIDILRQRNLSDPLLTATLKDHTEEIRSLQAKLATKDRECEKLQRISHIAKSIIDDADLSDDTKGRVSVNTTMLLFLRAELVEGVDNV